MKDKRIKDRTGEIYGKLTINSFSHCEIKETYEVIRNAQEKIAEGIYRDIKVKEIKKYNKPKKVVYWNCTCVCGNKKVVSFDELKNGSVYSCGCKDNPNIQKQSDREELQELVKKWLGYNNELIELHDGDNILMTEKSLTKETVLKLDGLSTGQFICNKKGEKIMEVPTRLVLLTAKYVSPEIKKVLDSYEFKDESHKVNFICRKISENINNMIDILKRRKENEEQIMKLDISYKNHSKAKYQKKSKPTPEKFKKRI